MRAELARRDEVAHAHEMRLEAVIIGGVADDALACAPSASSAAIVASLLRPQRLLDQHVLAVAQAVGRELDLRLVGNADQHRVVVGERNVGRSPDSAPRG